MQKVILHIGYGKTGTTAIQNLFAKNKQLFEQSGILYPQTGRPKKSHHSHHLLGGGEFDKFNKDLSETYTSLVDEIKTSKCHTTIISSEHFCFCKPNFIRDISIYLQPFEVKVVFYVRNQVNLVESTFLQWVKVGYNYRDNIEDFFSWHQESFDFLKRIEPWVTHFGAHSIMARLFHKEIIGTDICSDFNNLLGISYNFKDYSSKKSNTSLLTNFVPTIKLIDNLSINKDQRTLLIEEFLQLSQTFRNCNSFSLISQELQETINSAFKESNTEFANKFLSPLEAKLLTRISPKEIKQLKSPKNNYPGILKQVINRLFSR